MKLSTNARNAVMLGTLCSISYFFSPCPLICEKFQCLFLYLRGVVPVSFVNTLLK